MKNNTYGIDVLFTILKLLTVAVAILLARIVDHMSERVVVVLGVGLVFVGFVMLHRSVRNLAVDRSP